MKTAPLLPPISASLALLAAAALAGCHREITELPAASAATAAAAATLPKPVRVAGPVDDRPPPAPAQTGPLAVSWEDLDIGMEPDTVFQPWMLTARVKALEGKTVRISGYMCGAVFQADNIRTFPLLRGSGCPFGPGGQAHHVIEVNLQGKLRTSFKTSPVTVEGVFSVQPREGPDGKTWSLYHMEVTRIE